MTQEQIKFLKSNVKGRPYNELIDLFYNQFKIKLTRNKLKYWLKKYDLKNGFDGRFVKGQNAHNHKTIGYEFYSNSFNNHYVYIKAREPNTWVKKHRYIWERHYGKIPSGKTVIFLDGDSTNCDINNLALIDRRTELIMKNKHLFSKNKLVTKTGILSAQLSGKIYDMLNKKQNKQNRTK